MGFALHVLCPRHGGTLITRRPYDQHGYRILYLILLEHKKLLLSHLTALVLTVTT